MYKPKYPAISPNEILNCINSINKQQFDTLEFIKVWEKCILKLLPIIQE